MSPASKELFTVSQKNTIHFEKTLQNLQHYNTINVLSAAGALHLIPDNCSASIRLEAFSFVASCLQENPAGKALPLDNLKKILNSAELNAMAYLEDPFENLFTEEIHFYGGGYLVFPGIVENSVFITEHLCEALFLLGAFSDAKSFLQKISGMTQAILILSNAIAKKAGFTRYIKPDRSPRKHITLPSGQSFDLLQKAVTFNVDELSDILGRRHLHLEDLAPFITKAGSFKSEEYDGENMPLFKKPILNISSSFIVTLPGLLLPALRHEIILFAKLCGYQKKLCDAFRETCWQTARESLSFTQNYETNASTILETNPSGRIKQGVFSLDHNKVIYLQLWTDTLEDYDDSLIFGHYDSKNDLNELTAAEESAVKKILENYRGINEIVTLTVFQGVGRMHMIGLNATKANYQPLKILLSVADLETVCWLEGGKNLTWYQYAYANDNIRKTAKVLCTSALDEFGFYREQNYSYYTSDKQRPNMISIMPGYAGALREEVIKQRDFHTVDAFTPGYSIRVTNLHDDSRVPICAPANDLGKRIAFVLESYDIPIWILAPELSDELSGLRSLYFEFADMIAYWLWEATGELKHYVNEFVGQEKIISINLELDDPKTWLACQKYEIKKEVQITDACVSTVSRKSISLKLKPDFPYFFQGQNNEKERIFVAELIRLIRDFLVTARCNNSSKLGSREINAIIDRIAPIGLKKKFMVLDSSVNPLMDERDIPDERYLQPFNEQKLLDELGDYLVKECKYSEREIRNDEKIDFLNNKVVAHLFENFKKIISTLDPSGLIELLIAHNEAITRRRKFTELTIPTRIACFVSHQELLEELIKDSPKIDEAAGALRFLIEYVAAKPPHGDRRISFSIFDELMALSAAIINWGSISDLIRNDIADIRFAILPSERLGTNFEGFDQKRDLFRKDMLSDAMHKAKDRFGRFWRNLPKGKTPPEINAAFEEEWDYSWDDVADFVRETHTLGKQKKQNAIGYEQNSFIDHIIKTTALSEKKIRLILENLSIKPRDDFFVASVGIKADVYPWRHNRNLSYLRRPFILIERNAKNYVIWGNRHLQYAMDYLIGLMSSGRLKTKSKKMKELMSISQNRQGLRFNEKVFEHFKKDNRLIVDRRKKIPSSYRKSAMGEQNIGDIDVLIIEPSKKKIIAFECKDMSIARNPHELKLELDNMFFGKKSIIAKKEKVLAWLRRHKDLVLSHYSLSKDGDWEVIGGVIVDDIAFASYLEKKKLSILSFTQIKQMRFADIINAIRRALQ